VRSFLGDFLDSFRVLIVDDHEMTRRAVRAVLSSRPELTVCGEAADGIVAVERAKALRPDIILMDISMPRMNGLDATRIIRKELPQVIVVIVSQNDPSIVERHAQQVDAAGFVLKPNVAQTLIPTLERILAERAPGAAIPLKQIERASSSPTLEAGHGEMGQVIRNGALHLETVLSAAPLGVYLVDADLRILHLNPTARLVFGDTPDLIGRKFDEIIHILWPREYADEILEQFRHTLESGEPYYVPEHIEERADSGIREVYTWQINRIPLPDGRNGVVCYFQDVSRLVNAREAIAESEERLSRALDAAEMGAWEIDLATGTVWSTEQQNRIFGYSTSAPEWTSAKILEHVLPEDRIESERKLRQAIATRGDFKIECRIRRVDGAIRWVGVEGRVDTDAQGEPVGTKGMVRDITERKEAEERERQVSAEAIAANAKFRAVFDQAAVFAGIMTVDGIVVDANRLCLEGCGYTAEEILRRPFWETAWWRNSTEAQEKIRAGAIEAAAGIPYMEELPYHLADGTERQVLLALHPILDPEGKVIFIHPTGVDITERKQAERTTGLLAAIVDSSDDAIISKNLDGMITSWNRSAERLFGYRAEEAVGKHITLIIPPDRRDEEKTILERLKQGYQIDHFQTVRMRKDGSLLDISVTISPVRDSAGRVVGASKVARDITERVRAEEELRNSEEKLRILADELENQVRSRTRELEERNAEVLQQSEQLRDLSTRLLQAQDEERRHIARELHDSAGQIVTALGMTLGRIGQRSQANDARIDQELDECKQLTQQLSQEIRTTSYLLYPPLLDETGLHEALGWYIRGLKDRSGMDIRLNVSEDFGRLPREMELVVYRLVQECLTNIHRHSGSKTAAIGLLRDAEILSVEIQDTGRGIPKEKLKLMKSQGGGVGIRGMQERIRPFDGRMKIKSGDRGTTVSFVFPVARTAAPIAEDLDQQVEAAG